MAKQETELATPWFYELERAVRHGNYARAAHVSRKLERLGVEVRFHPAGPRRPGGQESPTTRGADSEVNDGEKRDVQ